MEEGPGLQISCHTVNQEVPGVCGNRKPITVFTKPHPCYLSWPNKPNSRPSTVFLQHSSQYSYIYIYECLQQLSPFLQILRPNFV